MEVVYVGHSHLHGLNTVTPPTDKPLGVTPGVKKPSAALPTGLSVASSTGILSRVTLNRFRFLKLACTSAGVIPAG